MDIYADRIDVDEFGPHNMLKALISESENVHYLPKSNFNFRVCFSDNKDYNAVAYEIGKYSWANMSFKCVKDKPEILPYDTRYKQLVFYAGPNNQKRYQVAELIVSLCEHESNGYLNGIVNVIVNV